MLYNDRITLITPSRDTGQVDVLGEPITVPGERIEVVCAITQLTDNQQIGLFGSYNLDAFNAYLMGRYPDVKEVIYKGKKRNVQATRFTRHGTVVTVA